MSATIEIKRGRGRPRGSSEDSRRVIWPIRLHSDEAAMIEKAAQKKGVSRTEWMRDVLAAAVE